MSEEQPIGDTGTTKDMPAVGPRPADQPANRGRSLVGFYIALGVVAALVGLGAWMYAPLRLRYAIYRVEHPPAGSPLSSEQVADYTKWFSECGDSACHGNNQALAAVVAMPINPAEPPFSPGTFGYKYVILACKVQPERFFTALDQQPESQVVKVLHELDYGCRIKASITRGAFVSLGGIPFYSTGISRQRAAFLVERFKAHSISQDPDVRRVAEAALDFTCRRFAKKLAEAEKAKPEAPSP